MKSPALPVVERRGFSFGPFNDANPEEVVKESSKEPRSSAAGFFTYKTCNFCPYNLTFFYLYRVFLTFYV